MPHVFHLLIVTVCPLVTVTLARGALLQLDLPKPTINVTLKVTIYFIQCFAISNRVNDYRVLFMTLVLYTTFGMFRNFQGMSKGIICLCGTTTWGSGT